MKQLIDKFGRIHDYLRISLTDKCNLRCEYCMPENMQFLKNVRLMSPEETIEIAKIFIYDFGINKIRFTGGEPLVSKNAHKIINEISKFQVELAITTNGIFLNDFLTLFEQIGLKSLNISLDTLKSERFKNITTSDQFELVKNNIDTAIEQGFKVKINIVVMKDINDDEIIDFVNWSINYPIHIRFIEFMPFYKNNWNRERIVSYLELKSSIQKKFEIEKLSDKLNSTSKSFRVSNAKGTFAFICTLSEPFCTNCNRLRLSADGRLRNCLFASKDMDLLTAYRNGLDIKILIQENIQTKEKELSGISLFEDEVLNSMSFIGG